MLQTKKPKKKKRDLFSLALQVADLAVRFFMSIFRIFIISTHLPLLSMLRNGRQQQKERSGNVKLVLLPCCRVSHALLRLKLCYGYSHASLATVCAHLVWLNTAHVAAEIFPKYAYVHVCVCSCGAKMEKLHSKNLTLE